MHHECQLPCCLHFPHVYTVSCEHPHSLWPVVWMEDSTPDIILIFLCLKCDQNRPLSKLLPSPVVLMGLKPHKVLRGLVPSSFTSSNLTAFSIFVCLIENLLLSVECKQTDITSKIKFWGMKDHEKGSSLELEFMKTCLFWQMILKRRFIFILCTVWIFLWGVRVWLLWFGLDWISAKILWALLSFCPPSCLLSPGHGRCFLMLISGISFLLLGAKENNKLRN